MSANSINLATACRLSGHIASFTKKYLQRAHNDFKMRTTLSVCTVALFYAAYAHPIQIDRPNSFSPTSPPTTTPNVLTPNLAAGVALHTTPTRTMASSLLQPNHWANPHYCRCVDKCLELEMKTGKKLRCSLREWQNSKQRTLGNVLFEGTRWKREVRTKSKLEEECHVLTNVRLNLRRLIWLWPGGEESVDRPCWIELESGHDPKVLGS